MKSAQIRRLLRDALPTAVVSVLQQSRERPAPGDWAAVELDRARRARRRDLPYPHYLYGLLAAARTAKACAHDAFCVIEFGVAGGNGLVAMEQHAEYVRTLTGISIDVHGFDTGAGLPASVDPRDCPFAFRGGEFQMDGAALRSRLGGSCLWLGDVADRIQDFIATDHSPIGFISNDFDFYTSTLDSFECLQANDERTLPRVHMYFDDLAGYPYSTLTGEWAAISEFNRRDAHCQIAQIWGLKFQLGAAFRHAWWNESMFIAHFFDHNQYSDRENATFDALRLHTP